MTRFDLDRSQLRDQRSDKLRGVYLGIVTANVCRLSGKLAGINTGIRDALRQRGRPIIARRDCVLRFVVQAGPQV